MQTRHRIVCSLIAFPVTLLLCAQEPARRGTMSDAAYMAQMEAAGVLADALKDGRSAGLRSFFAAPEYYARVEPTLDSLAKAWAKYRGSGMVISGDITGPMNVMRATVLEDRRVPVAEIALSYDPFDRSASILHIESTPTKEIRLSEADLPAGDEPPPTLQQLLDAKPK